ncbi:hypothetical protein LPJ66_008846 [Kickxella alabastrina]|uniref:Uncharacterized protein n=1 Tax=Kickxella alabastrina TaxID=61397 RepID=A0ACC1I7F2_9FUNG|nr:hypothetical protein LPJ66_008846 [Kickxella alabastrina]
MRLIVMELQRYKALPSVLFRTLSKAMRTAEMADEVRLRLDELLHTGAGTWVGFTTSGVRPKYAQAGSELRDALLGQFAALLPSAKRRHVFSYMRVISGLIGYLRLDVTGADFEFFKQAAGTTSDHRNSADVCAALFLVLAGFGTRTSNQNIMLAIVDVSESPVARQIDCLLAHLVTDQVKDVNSFVTSALAMDFSYPRDRLFYLKDIASDSTTSYFSRASLARRLVACPSPSAPCEGGVNSVPTALHRAAVLNFLRSATFQNSGVDVREWMTRLMRGADTATANACGPLVRAYVSAIFSSPSITPVPETLLWSEFAAEAIKDSACHHAPPSQVLFLMYVLYYCEQLLEQPKRPNSAFSVLARRPAVVAPPLVNGVQPRAGPFGISVGANSSRAGGLGSLALGRTAGPGRGSPLTGLYDVVKRGEYSDQLLDSLPVSWILHKVGRDTEYQLVWPELLSMATAQHPDQLDVVSVLQRELAAGFSQESSHLGADSGGQQLPRREAAEFASSGSTADFFKQIKAARMLIGSMLLPSNSDEPPSIRALRFTVEEYSKLSVSVRMVMCGLLAGQLCRAAVAGYDDNELTASVRQTWLSLHALSPHAVSAATVNAWRSEAEAIKPRLAAQDIWLDPLVVFRSDTRVFQSASLVDILLVVLGEFLVLSRTSMRRIYALRQRDDGALKKSHLTALIQLQESSALQLLIETARFVQDDEVKWLVYEFIHARFLEQRTIQKLVHFQAYAIEAIDDMVGYVPSMHACSEFIPELLMQSAPRLQLFAIKLAAAITTKYPIMANEGMAKEVILPHIQTTLVQIAGTAIAEQLAISNAMLAAVVSIGCAFPTIREECRRLVAAVKDSAVERARSVHQAQAQVQAQPVQLQHQQQNFARWIGCCEHVVALIDAPDQDERPQFVHIEDTEAGKIAIRLEKLFQPDKGGHAGHIASPRLADFSGQPLPANGPPVPPGALRPPGPPPPHFHPSHQSAQQYGVPPGQQKRSHSLITGGSSGGERGDRGGRMSAQRDAGGPPLDYSRSRGGNASGTGSSRLPDHMSGHSSGGISPGGNAGSSGNFKKRSRHRSGNAGGGNNPKSHGHGGPNKRGKAPGGERPHIKDH